MTLEDLQERRAELTAQRDKIIEELHDVAKEIHRYEDAQKAEQLIEGLSDEQRIAVASVLDTSKIGTPGNN